MKKSSIVNSAEDRRKETEAQRSEETSTQQKFLETQLKITENSAAALSKGGHENSVGTKTHVVSSTQLIPLRAVTLEETKSVGKKAAGAKIAREFKEAFLKHREWNLKENWYDNDGNDKRWARLCDLSIKELYRDRLQHTKDHNKVLREDMRELRDLGNVDWINRILLVCDLNTENSVLSEVDVKEAFREC